MNGFCQWMGGDGPFLWQLSRKLAVPFPNPGSDSPRTPPVAVSDAFCIEHTANCVCVFCLSYSCVVNQSCTQKCSKQYILGMSLGLKYIYYSWGRFVRIISDVLIFRAFTRSGYWTKVTLPHLKPLEKLQKWHCDVSHKVILLHKSDFFFISTDQPKFCISAWFSDSLILWFFFFTVYLKVGSNIPPTYITNTYTRPYGQGIIFPISMSGSTFLVECLCRAEFLWVWRLAKYDEYERKPCIVNESSCSTLYDTTAQQGAVFTTMIIYSENNAVMTRLAMNEFHVCAFYER